MPIIISIIKTFLILVILKYFNINANSELEFLSKFNQHDYKMTFQRLDLDYYDKEVFEYGRIITFKYNRTTAVSNITLVPKIDFDTHQELTVIIQVYKFLSNEFRHFPIHFQVDFCKACNSDMVGLTQLFTQGNFSKTCEFKKGVIYHAYNFVPNPEKFPPLVPNGNYKVEFNVQLKDRLILTLSGTSVIYRPL